MSTSSPHRLTRSETDRRIAGVCGGIAEYYDVDPILIRVGFIVAAFIGFGILLYIVLWIVMPKGTPGIPVMGPRHASSAIHIAESRFARGEITAADLAQIRQDLES
ncbi:MAG: PspC domain-containing protein [Actinobacteria bacterium]|jgi:phage shock protein C|nr:MAG: PspC domain-containing protein [Actinomycetota bacterium]